MKKTLVVVAYHFNIEGLLELNAEAPIFVQLNENVAHTSIIVAPAALPRKTVVVRVRYFLHILAHYFSRKFRPLDISYIF